MPTRNSRAIGVRIKNEVITAIEQRAKRRGWSFNKWMNWAVVQGLRKHTKTTLAEHQ
uniref:Uncharacterized protein n=1 Tax=viral metagenome TaxID=1070528 RepID=A0A6M3LEA2_9ZZZZ